MISTFLTELQKELQIATDNQWWPQNYICMSTEDETTTEMLVLQTNSREDCTDASERSHDWMKDNLDDWLAEQGFAGMLTQKSNYHWDYHLKESPFEDKETSEYDYPVHLHIMEGDTSFTIILTIKTI